MIKIPATLLLLGGLFYGVHWSLAIYLPDQRRARDDSIYAQRVFETVLDCDAVLAIRAWHRQGSEAWDCTYAIVSLPENATATPPTLDAKAWFLRFGGDWRQTPIPALGDTTRDALAFCAQYWAGDVIDRLRAARSEPGSWYSLGPVGESVHTYSAPQQIAARVR